jgi:protease PrsW
MSFDFRIILFTVFGIMPSLLWLAYYLRKDIHPEPKKTVVRIFLWGVFVTLPVFFIQIGMTKILNSISLDLGLYNLDYLLRMPLLSLGIIEVIIVSAYWFLVIALSEEFFKYLVIKTKVIGSPDLDEPVDIMLYMIIAALGFSALENILYLFTPIGQLSFNELVNRTIIISIIRFLGATFLHTLCSGVIGYFLAMSFCEPKKKVLYVAGGIFFATALHGLYDFSIMTLEGYAKLLIPIIILAVLIYYVFNGIEKLKELKSVCKVN